MEIGGAGRRMPVVGGKQEINLEWPNGRLSVYESLACEPM